MTSLRPAVVEIIEPLMVEILRQQSPAQRLGQAFRMWDCAKIMIRGAVRQQRPDWSEDRVLQETARRLSHGATEYVSR